MNLFLLFLLALSSAGIIYTLGELNRSRKALRRYDSLSSQENFIEQLNLDIHNRQRELQNLDQQCSSLKKQISQLKQQIPDFEEELYVQSFGFYQTKYNFINSGDYEFQLKRIKEQQRGMIKNNDAAICNISLSLNDSEKEGQKLSQNFLKLILTIFNSECDTVINKVKTSNIDTSEEKIKRVFNDLNKKSKIINCEITEEYLKLKIRELHLKYELECKKQEEKEQEQEIRNQMKQEEKENRKLEEEAKKIREAEENESQYRQQLAIALRQQESVAKQERRQLEVQIEQLRQNLAKAISDKEAAISRSAMVKAGYIYIISNIGSLGRDVYRICMTKRSTDEDGYIKEMSPVVPFPFDIHFKFISEDASDTLRRLHERFKDRRVNAINLRRDFFEISIDEIAQAVEDIKKETGALKNIQYEKAPQALEYRRTIAIKRKDDHTAVNTQSA